MRSPLVPKEHSVDVVIEVPRMGFVKRRDDGSLDFISPLPCPFNYGSVPGTISGDGDPLDAVVLGPRLPRGARVRARVLACVSFVDAGQDDPKWICTPTGDRLHPADRRRVVRFFSCYALAKRALNRLRGKQGTTAYRGIQLAP